jgi:broad specificity phosphatase PhoE
VYDRVGGFLESLFRSFEAPDHPPNVLLVTHGLAMRLFCMRWFHWTVADFESLSNPGNAEMRMLVLGEDGKYTLDRPFDRWRDPEAPWMSG